MFVRSNHLTASRAEIPLPNATFNHSSTFSDSINRFAPTTTSSTQSTTTASRTGSPLASAQSQTTAPSSTENQKSPSKATPHFTTTSASRKPDRPADNLCDPSPPYASDKIPYGCFVKFPTVGKTLTQSLEELVDLEPHPSEYTFPNLVLPFSCLFLMATVLNFVNTIPNDSPLRPSLVLFLRHFGTHTTLLERFKRVQRDSPLKFFLSISFRRLLINLTQFLSDEDTSSVLQLIQSHYGGFEVENDDFLQNCVVEEVTTLLPDSPRPSPLRIEATRSYLLTLSKTVSFYFSFSPVREWRHFKPLYVNDAWCALVSDYLQQENVPAISKTRLDCFPCSFLVSSQLASEMLSFIATTESLSKCECCFSLLSRQEPPPSPHPLEPSVFLGLVEKTTSLLRNRESNKLHKTIFRTLRSWVNWDQLELSSMFPPLLPLLSEAARVISRRTQVHPHSAFLEHVAVSGINKLRKTNLADSPRRSATRILLRIALNFPTVQGTNQIVGNFSFTVSRAKSTRVKEIQDLTTRLLVEGGCEDLFASAGLETIYQLRFRAMMNHPSAYFDL
ncbi:hypothetical protein BLNAU_11437 [Blattamonas nauphoetae]|uniref:Uncharacterized protein n=1 Tax=Blattamonas nauphoetae TaxID=2049346 RepID=A0ABQ9XMC9_9EUKA|nr:hypothetical protein BLNAU_11437 [Blattamonas nauphoetae]